MALEAHGNGQQSLLLGAELAAAEARLATWLKREVELLCPLDTRYPANLRAAAGAPVAVFLQGRPTEADAQTVAVIGSRSPSREGVEEAVAVATELAAAGITILSGLAAGIDAAVHRTAISLGARTTAAIGTGHLHVYPPQHRELQAEIARRSALLSPFPPETPAARWTFPVRNALMAGMALAMVVVEASTFSGTRSAVRAALARSRPVFLSRQVEAQPWARELRDQQLVQVFSSPTEISDAVKGITARPGDGGG